MSDPRITDEAMKKAVDAATGVYGGPSGRMRAALEAALPHIAPQPMPTREQFAEATHDFDHAHSWRDERFCPQYACLEVYLPRADAVLALLNGTAK